MAARYTMSGKCGDTVYQRNRYGQIAYPAFVPFNPRTDAQCAVRNTFGAVSAPWRTLTQEQRNVWVAVASTKKSRPRLGCGPLTGFNYFVKVNVALAHCGQAQADLPPGYPRFARPTVSGVSDTSQFAQPPVGPTLYLQAKSFLEDSRAGLSPRTHRSLTTSGAHFCPA
jgi:hypothetical protein